MRSKFLCLSLFTLVFLGLSSVLLETASAQQPSEEEWLKEKEINRTLSTRDSPNVIQGPASQRVFNGSLTAADPTFNRPNVNCAGLSTNGTAVRYDAIPFVVNASGTVTLSFETADGGSIAPNANGGPDTFLVVYTGTFNPASPLTNCLIAADDISSTNYRSLVSQPLAAGNYTAVVTSFQNIPGTQTPGPLPWTYGLSVTGPLEGQFPGTLTTTDPTFNRPNVDCSTLSTTATAVRYDAIPFAVATAGTVTLSFETGDGGSISPTTADTFLIVYTGIFNAASPLTNCTAANDDTQGGSLRSRIVAPLAAGNYTAVVTSFVDIPTEGAALPWTYRLAIVGGAPTARVNVSGRVFSSAGRGVTNAKVKLTGTDGLTQSLVTGRLGAFVFSNVESGRSYTLSVTPGRFTFSPRVIDVNSNIADIEFYPATGSSWPSP